MEDYGTSYKTGVIIFKPLHTNIGATTINVNSLGQIPIKVSVDKDTVSGDIVQNQMAVIIYDGLNMQLLNPIGGTGGTVTILTNSSDPTNLDSSYDIGQEWLNTTTKKVFKLVDNTTSNAVWKKITVEDQLSNYLPLSGTTELEGDIIPKTGNAVDLGSSSKKFLGMYGFHGYFSYIYNLIYFACSPTFYDDKYLGFGYAKGLKIYHNSSNITSYISTQQNHDTIFSANPTGSAEIPMLTMKADGSKVEANKPISDPTYGNYFNQSTFNFIQTKTTSFTLSLLDWNSTIKMTNGGTVTIPTNANASFLIGTKIDIISHTDGTITFNPLSGVTLLSQDDVRTFAKKYHRVKLTKTGVDEWVLSELPTSGGGVEVPKVYGLRYEDNGTDFTYTRLLDAQGISVTRSSEQSIGSYTGRIINNGFANLEYFKVIKRVILTNNGDEVATEGEVGYDDTLSTGTLSPKTHVVAVRIPKFYFYKKFTGSTITEIYISEKPFTIDGVNAEIHPAFYRDRNGDNVAEPVEFIYMPAFEGVLWDDSVNKCVSGNENGDNTANVDLSNDLICSFNTIGYDGHADGLRPYNGLNIGEFRSLCENRNNNSQYGWGQQWYLALTAIQTLYQIIFADFDSQSVLSQGFTKSTNTKPLGVGHSSILGNQSGYVNVTKYYDGSAITDSGTDNNGTECLSFLGIENFYGNIRKWIDGFATTSTYHIGIWQKEFNTLSTTIPQQAWKDISNFGWSSNMGGYMSGEWRNTDTIDSKYMCGIPKTVTGSTSTYYCDYTVLNAGRVANFGGYWSYGLSAGPFLLIASYSLADAYSSIGAALSL